MRHRCPPIPAVVAAAAAVAVLAAGCGGGNSSPTTSARPDAATAGFGEGYVKFAVCMRSHGLSSYPDPKVSESGGRGSITISPGGLDPNSAAFKSGSQACHHFLPNGGSPPANNPKEQAADLVYAACMRSHGVPNFPDPDRDGAFTLPSGIDEQASPFQRATKACANVEPSSISILSQPPSSS